MPRREWLLRVAGADLPTVWKTIQEDLPLLIAQMEQIEAREQ